MTMSVFFSNKSGLPVFPSVSYTHDFTIYGLRAHDLCIEALLQRILH